MNAALDFRNTNSLWASVLVETMVRAGVTHAVVSPGSRSAPLAIAFAQHRGIEALPVLDERSAAFFALGLAKQNGRPVVLLCTSGTAGVNYFPAIVEARESGVPLVVITADRPPEMRDCASGQTIDQQKLYGAYVKWYHELATPEPGIEQLRYLRQTALHAVERARATPGGPVHLNAPFRDPLPPIEDKTARGLENVVTAEFFAHLQAGSAQVARSILWQKPVTTRGLIVAGPAAPRNPREYAQRVGELSRALKWPVLADALSPLRHYGMDGVTVVTAYDAILRSGRAAQELAPRYVLCLEGWPTSKVLRGWIEQSQAEVLMVSPLESNRDALHGKTRQIVAEVEALAASGSGPGDLAYGDAWRTCESTVRAELDRALESEHGRFEGKAAWLLARHLPEATPVFVASSMPIRDVEYLWPAGNRGHRLYFNRGANGIDGTLSTAMGVAHGNAQPAVLLCGDLALLHDSNGFLLRAKLRGSLTIVLINNNGGGIFEHLPVAQFDPPFEEFFATPQNMDFGKLCAAHEVTYAEVRDWGEFTRLITNLPAKGVRVLELKTDRKRDAAYRKSLFAKCAAALG